MTQPLPFLRAASLLTVAVATVVLLLVGPGARGAGAAIAQKARTSTTSGGGGGADAADVTTTRARTQTTSRASASTASRSSSKAGGAGASTTTLAATTTTVDPSVSTTTPALLVAGPNNTMPGGDKRVVEGVSTDTALKMVIGGLLAVAAAITALTVAYWRHTRPAPVPAWDDDDPGYGTEAAYADEDAYPGPHARVRAVASGRAGAPAFSDPADTELAERTGPRTGRSSGEPTYSRWGWERR